MLDKILSNKKMLAGLCVLTIGVIVFTIIRFLSLGNGIERVDDREVETYNTDINKYISENHPIDDVLPIINEEPYYCISFIVKADSENYYPYIEIFYQTDEGKIAAMDRLQALDLYQYNPSQYKIKYTRQEI